MLTPASFLSLHSNRITLCIISHLSIITSLSKQVPHFTILRWGDWCLERYNEYHQGQRASECHSRDSQPWPVSIVLFLLHCLCLWLSQCGPGDSQTCGELTRSTVIWHGVTDSVIMHTRSLWLLTQHLWDGSEDPVAHPHQLIFFRSSL